MCVVFLSEPEGPLVSSILENAFKGQFVVGEFIHRIIVLHGKDFAVNSVRRASNKETLLEVATADRRLCGHTFICLLYLCPSRSQRDMNSLCAKNQMTHGGVFHQSQHLRLAHVNTPACSCH